MTIQPHGFKRSKGMTSNIGMIDRVLRVIVGAVLITLAFIGPQTPWGYIGIIPILTALIGFCPAYRLLGVCTLKKST